jgi:hypothetical protein
MPFCQGLSGSGKSVSIRLRFIVTRYYDNQTAEAYEPVLGFACEAVVHQHGLEAYIAKNCVESKSLTSPTFKHFKLISNSLNGLTFLRRA